MTRHVWANPETFVRSPSQAAAVLRLLELPQIDQYLDALAESGGLELNALRRLSENTLVAMSGDDHLKTRRVIAPFFSRAGLACWRPLYAQATNEAADVLAVAATPDLVKDFTLPLFLKLMPTILGLNVSPEEEQFRAVETAQRVTEPYLSVPTLKAMNKAVALLLTTCPEPGERCHGARPEDRPETLLEYLYRRRTDLPEKLDPRYLVLGLLVGGNSATQSLAFALYGLLTGPSSLWQDAASPDWAERETQKILGLYQSTRTLVRVATQPVQVGECPYHQGQTAVVDIIGVNVCLRAENGDLNAHMSFGSGPHKCPGSFLSEMLIEMAIPALARRFPNIVLRKERCQFVQTPMMQAPIALPCDTAQISRRVTAKLFDIRDMSSARHILHNDESFAPPPMAEHLATLAEKSGRDFDTAILIAQNAMFFMDDPRHNGLRTSIMALLGGNRLAKWENVMDAAIAGALTGLEQMPKPDLVTGFSDRIRQFAVAPILGISSLDPARFEEIVPGLQQVLEPWLPLRELDSVQAIFGEALSLMTVPARSGGAPSLLEGLLSDVPEGFDEQDIKAVALVLYGASFNLSHTLANILHWILIRPKEVRQGFDQPEWIDLHLNELLAQCSGPKYIYRIARHDVQVGDLTMNAGDTARLVVHGLNQQAPAGAGHVSFGRGLHSCVGAGLSRLAIRRAVPALFARFPNISLIAQEQAYFSMSQTVALSTLPCTLNTKQNEKDCDPK